jgi:hypothetical protein
MSTLLNVNSPDSPALDSTTHQPNPVALKTTKSILTVEEIQKLLPQVCTKSLLTKSFHEKIKKNFSYY